MKKLFSTCLMAMAIATMSAQEEIPFTLTPAPGSTVQSITVTSPIILDLPEDSPYQIFEIVSPEDIYFTLNGEKYCGILRTGWEAPYEIKPAEDITSPGEYQLVFGAYSLSWAKSEYEMPIDNTEDLTYTYLVEGNGMNNSDGLPFTVTPADDSKVDALESIVFTLNPESGYVMFDYDYYEWTIERNGEFKCGVQCEESSDGLTLTITPLEQISEDGVYTLTIPGYTFFCNPEDSNEMPFFTDDALVFTYTIGEGGSGNTTEYPFVMADPEPGVVNNITYAILELLYESGYDKMLVNNPEGIYFTRDGEYFTATQINEAGSMLEIMPEDYISEGGEYALVIEAGAISWTTEGSSEAPVTNNEQIVYKYTVESTSQALPIVVTPADGSEITELSEITISLAEDSGFDYIDLDTYSVAIIKDYDFEPVATVIAEQDYDNPTYYRLVVADMDGNPSPITTPGNYQLVIEAYAMVLGSENSYPLYNENNLFYNFYVEDAATPVAYDVVPKYTTPDEGVIDFEMKDFSSLTLYFDETMYAAAGAKATVTPVDAPDEAVYAEIKSNRMPNQLIMFFDKLEVHNGEYVITIPQGSFGDEAWINNPETGHSNPELTYTFTIVGATDRSNVEYTLVPEIVPNSEYKMFTVMFNNREIQMAEDATAVFSCTEARYYQTAKFTSVGNGIFNVTFEEAPAEAGTYVFTIEQGVFGTKDFFTSEKKSGNANARIDKTFEIKATGIDAISSDNVPEGVYNLMGVKVADTTENLPAGIYIVNGKKVIVK